MPTGLVNPSMIMDVPDYRTYMMGLAEKYGWQVVTNPCEEFQGEYGFTKDDYGNIIFVRLDMNPDFLRRKFYGEPVLRGNTILIYEEECWREGYSRYAKSHHIEIPLRRPNENERTEWVYPRKGKQVGNLDYYIYDIKGMMENPYKYVRYVPYE